MAWLEAVAHPVRLGIFCRLSKGGPATIAELHSALQVSDETVRRDMRHLVAEGVVAAKRTRADSERRGAPPIVYGLSARTIEGMRELSPSRL
jgi:predicted ArsR family transcriptional regulator